MSTPKYSRHFEPNPNDYFPRVFCFIHCPENEKMTCQCGKIAKYKTIVVVDHDRRHECHSWTCYHHKEDIEMAIEFFKKLGGNIPCHSNRSCNTN